MKEKIFDYISNKILNNEKEIAYDTALYSTGIMKSMAHLKLINYLERTFDISIEIHKVKIDNFNTVEKIAKFIESEMHS